MPTIVLSSPAALVASVPYLVGFTPHDSLILIWLRSAEILLTQRADLPSRCRPEWIQSLWHHSLAAHADALVIVGMCTSTTVDHVVAAVAEHAEKSGLEVRDAIVTDGATWRSVRCNDPACACAVPLPVGEDVTIAVAAEFAFRGVAPLPDRSSLVAEVSPIHDAQVVGLLARRGITRPSSARAVEAWRDRLIHRLLAGLGPGPGLNAPQMAAMTIAGLQDIRVRDVLLWHLARWEVDELRRALGILQYATRCAPEGTIAGVATVCAIAAWLVGDGARASVCLHRAQQGDPQYTLAHMLSVALASGLPPSSWREATAEIPLEVCRRGGARHPHRSVVAPQERAVL